MERANAPVGPGESDEHLHQIASALRVAIWIRDATTRKVLYVNPAFEEIFGLSRQVFYDNPDTAVNTIHPEDRKLFTKGEIGFSIEHRIIRPDGSLRWVWGRNFPVKNEAGEIYRIASIVEDITERKEVEQELKIAYDKLQRRVEEIQGLHSILRDHAIKDFLTGLFNRRYLDETLDLELERAKRGEYPVSLMMMDIDNFKKINDAYGHQSGDLVLQSLAGFLKQHMRASDIICRYAGDEFVVVLPTSPVGPAFQRAEDLRRSFQAEKIQNSIMKIHATISVGIATYPIHGDTSEKLLTAADDAMYTAKDQGKNRVVLWTPSHN